MITAKEMPVASQVYRGDDEELCVRWVMLTLRCYESRRSGVGSLAVLKLCGRHGGDSDCVLADNLDDSQLFVVVMGDLILSRSGSPHVHLLLNSNVHY